MSALFFSYYFKLALMATFLPQSSKAAHTPLNWFKIPITTDHSILPMSWPLFKPNLSKMELL